MKPSIHTTTKFLIVALSFAAGLAVGIGVKTTALGRWAKLSAQESQLKADPHLLVAVPDVLQDTDYSCGASALQAVLAYWGIDVRESTLITALHSDPQNSTRPEEIIRVAREHGLRAEMREGIGIPDLRRRGTMKFPLLLTSKPGLTTAKQVQSGRMTGRMVITPELCMG